MITGQQWREWRERKGLSLREFARVIDVSPTYVSMVETDSDPANGYSRHTSMRAAIALGLNASEAALALERWRQFHSSEVAAIDQFIGDIVRSEETRKEESNG